MENTPHNIDVGADSEKKESKSKKKKAETIGSFVVDSKKSKEKPAKDSAEHFWDKPAKAEDVKAKPESTHDADPAQGAIESEITAPLEQLGEPEKQFVERELTKAEQEADLEPIDAVERFRNRIIEGQDSDTALTETVAELEALPDAESAESMAAETDQEVDENAPREFGEEEILLNEADGTDAEDEAEAEDPASTPPAVPAPAGGGTPPRSPRPPAPPTGPTGPFGTPGSTPPWGPRSVVNPAVPVAANAAPLAPVSNFEHRQDQANTVGAALVGGIVGYLIGRRRGRIKTEKRLLPVQKKLKKEVVNLQEQLQQKEARIRALAATKATEKLQPRAEKVLAPAVAISTERLTTRAPEAIVPVVARAPLERVRSDSRAPAVEDNKLLGESQAPEHIGHMLVGAESVARSLHVSERAAKPISLEKTVKAEKLPPQKLTVEKNIDTLNRAELMRISEKIIIDSTSLRQIYESRLVGEKGLRRLVKEHLKGGDIKKALRREIVEREIDFERDPGLRDQAPQAAPTKGGGRAATLNDLLQNAEIAVGEDQEEVAFLKARSAYEEQVREQQKGNRRLMDVSLVSIILILLAMVIILVINHS